MAAADLREVTDQERVLLQFAVRDNLPWIELRDKFNAIFPGKYMQSAALQMKKKRLIEKLQGWTEAEVRKVSKTRSFSSHSEERADGTTEVGA